MLLRRVGLADLLTISNGMCGLAVVAVALGHVDARLSAPLSHRDLVLCGALIWIGSVCDLLDGAVARRRGASGLGPSLDLMGDLLTFGLAPASLVVASSARAGSPWPMLSYAGGAFLVVAAMLRLARYSSASEASTCGFAGLPMPLAAAAALAVVVVNPVAPLELAGVLAVGGLMVSRVPYPHPSRRTIPLLVAYWCLAAAALVGALPLKAAAATLLVAVPAIPVIAVLAQTLSASAARRSESPREIREAIVPGARPRSAAIIR